MRMLSGFNPLTLPAWSTLVATKPPTRAPTHPEDDGPQDPFTAADEACGHVPGDRAEHDPGDDAHGCSPSAVWQTTQPTWQSFL